MNTFLLHNTAASWGSVVFIMEKQGKAFARMYQYKEDSTTIYLDSLSVDASVRKQGIGTELQELREKIGRNLGATSSFLWVLKDSWMRDWYKRRGYEDYNVYEENEDYVWMKKILVDNVSHRNNLLP